MSRVLLLADIGNSRVKWARCEAGRLRGGVPFASDPARLAPDLDTYWLPLDPPAAVYAANVAGPAIAEILAQWIDARWGIPVRFAQSRTRQGGVINGYTQPEQLGVDRWLGLLGLRLRHALPACLVDCGTAITVDVLDAEGRHRGGVIAPGLMAMRRALHQETHALGLAEEVGTASTFGRDTASGIAAGGLLAAAGLVEKVVAAATAELQEPVRLVLTGGDAAPVGRHLGLPVHLDESVVLAGLLVWAEG